MTASLALAQPPIIFNNGEVNTTSATFNTWVLVDNLDPATATTLIVNSPAEFNGANNFDTSLDINSTSILQFNGGTVSQDIDFYDDTIGIFNGGTVEDDIYVYDNATVTFNDITLAEDLEIRDSSLVTINGGNFNEDVTADQGSRVVINGGTIAEDLESFFFASIEINGGSIGEDIEAYEGSSILISGGNMGDRIRTFDDGEITIRGTDFSLDGTPIVVTEGIEFNGIGTLAGILRDGTPFSTVIETNGGGGNFITIIPEPATGLLLILGGTALALRRRKR